MAYMYPNKCHSVLVALLHSSNQLYGYDSNFSKRFNFTLCSKCNSQLTRDQNTYYKNEKNKDPTQENNQILINEKSETTIKQSDKISKVENTPNSDSSFTLEKKPVDYYEFEELILQRVCEAVEAVDLLVHNDYKLLYKSEKGIGAGTILEEEEDFEEFIKEYYRLTSSNKVLLITVIIQKKETVKRKMKYLILDDGEESISEENEITSPSKQKKKTSVPKESNLDEIDLMKGKFIRNSKKSIMDYKNHCDYETPPPHPNFGMGNSLKVPSSNQSSTASANAPYPPHPPSHSPSHPPSHPPLYSPSITTVTIIFIAIYIITSIKYLNFTI
ncbi:hypothetical protein RhiirB3_454952 [Rhizophagus irregularis]|nr:hypothetical protein RhiirB3_454952 [Rhizophagus irregularis]